MPQRIDRVVLDACELIEAVEAIVGKVRNVDQRYLMARSAVVDEDVLDNPDLAVDDDRRAYFLGELSLHGIFAALAEVHTTSEQAVVGPANGWVVPRGHEKTRPIGTLNQRKSDYTGPIAHVIVLPATHREYQGASRRPGHAPATATATATPRPRPGHGYGHGHGYGVLDFGLARLTTPTPAPEAARD